MSSIRINSRDKGLKLLSLLKAKHKECFNTKKSSTSFPSEKLKMFDLMTHNSSKYTSLFIILVGLITGN